MAENVGNLILVQLRELREDMMRLRADVNGRKGGGSDGVEEVSRKIDGLTMIVTMLAGRIQQIEERAVRREKTGAPD